MIKLPDEKQTLIEKCKKDIAQMQSWHDGDDYSQDIKVYEIALETLTAKPVEWQLQCLDETVPEENRWFDYQRYDHKVTALKNQRVVEYYTHPLVQFFRPVQLPDISAGKYYTGEGVFKAFDYKRDLVAAIRAAGGEVSQ